MSLPSPFVAAMGLVLAGLSLGAAPPSATQKLFVIDNDFSGPGGSDLQPVLFFLDNPDAKLLGLTVVTGDDWMKVETAHLLRFLEIAGHPEIPVVEGARVPLVNTPRRIADWEARYGKLSWKGAWNKPETDGTVAGFDPDAVPTLEEGNPTIKAAPGAAAAFLVDAVRKHPHEVSIIALGPLTNIALATSLDPEFPSLVKEIVMTNGPATNLDPATGKVGPFTSGFNFVFDPEAADIVLRAPFPRIVSVGPVAERVSVDQSLIDAIAAKKTPLAAYLAKYAWKDLPMWDETATAIALDPTLALKSVDVLTAIDLGDGATHGSAIAFDAKSAPGRGERPVSTVLDFDAARYREMLLGAVR
ncbi:nucleoside hydrolase [Mesorhizobium sp. BR1-1-16]|uniref:nucleoside hydrolase n=1 Tax=Mesorhizobium sp. BR1-1-16 TaxID=2876653 RepID=UPI001CC9DE52|nr:nucleoside hydrolase [Mesorhizobium sp. BR1-1-16]MBZ9936190.1 nucleoside hydrolase [Mesorhizobium sp. BR1-1-16]